MRILATFLCIFSLVRYAHFSEKISQNEMLEISVGILRFYRVRSVHLLHSNKQKFSDENEWIELEKKFSRSGVYTELTDITAFDRHIEAVKLSLKNAYVLLTAGEDIRTVLKKVLSTPSFQKSIWVMFLQSNSLIEFFEGIDVLINTNVLVCSKEDGQVVIQSVYRVRSTSDITTAAFGLWSPTAGLKISSSGSYEQRSDLQGLELRAASLLSQDDNKINPDVKDRGLLAQATDKYFAEVFRILKGNMNFTITYVKPEDGIFGTHEGARWTGLFELLRRGEVDFIMAALVMSSDLLKHFDFITPLLVSRMYVYVQKMENERVWTKYVVPFAFDLWLAYWTLVLGFILLFAVIYRVRNLDNEEDGKVLPFRDIPIYVFGGFCCNQGFPETPLNSASRVVFITMFLCAVVMSAAYSASIISSLATRTTVLPFLTISEVIRDKHFILEATSETLLNEIKQDTKIDELRSLYARLFGTRSRLPSTLESMEKACSSRKYAFIGRQTLVMENIHLFNCKIMNIPEIFMRIPLAMAFRKNEPLLDIINRKIVSMYESGALKRIMTKIVYEEIIDEAANFRVVEVTDISSLLSVLLVATALAILIYMVEKSLHEKHKREQMKAILFKKHYSSDLTYKYRQSFSFYKISRWK